jgi:hypothetical protein
MLFDSYDAATDGERAFLQSVLRDSFKDLSMKYPNLRPFADELPKAPLSPQQ